MNPDRIIFIYNADSGFFNALTDWSHRFFSPETHQCSLCRYTFGLTGMLIPWKNFLQKLPFPSTFLYRDDFRPRYPSFAAMSLPLILVEKNDVSELLIDAGEIKETGGLADLIALVQVRLENWASARTGGVRPNSPAH